MKNRRKCNFGIWMLFFIVTALLFAVPEKEAEAAQKRLSSITAVYTGDTVLVGHSVDLEKLTVMGLYSDGSYVKLKDYVLSTYVIGSKGNNLISVMCDGVQGYFVVQGKEVTLLSATYAQGSMTIGEQLDREKLTVYAYYSDGTSGKPDDYILSHTVVGKLGLNEFTVFYEGKTTKFSVTGKEERRPRSMYASYVGPAVIVGNAPKREDFYVSVFYTDNTMDRITAFELTPSVIQKEGSNTVVVSYGELSADVTVIGLAKTVMAIQAEYTGLPVIVGKSVAPEDIKVTATFNDGTKDTVTNFTLSSSVVYKIGDNLITVFCDGKVAFINVRGVEAEIIDYSNRAEAFIRDGNDYTRVKLAVGAKVKPEDVVIKKVESGFVKKAMRRLVQTEEYLAFEVSLLDPELDVFLPMTMKVSVPKGYDRENFAVFYTPNRKTIMAQMNGEFLKDGTYEFKMFQPGTYIVADCTALIYVESLHLEEENLTLRLGRSYSLDPEILPHTATNKEVAYTSSRPQIVSVSKYGTLKALKTGTAIITAEAKDGSGKKCKLRVNVVEKKGKFDAEIAELSDILNDVHTADEFVEFLDYLAEDMKRKSRKMEEDELKEYTKELEGWIGGLDDAVVGMDEEEWLLLPELLYETGKYSYATLLFGGKGRFKEEIREIDARLDAIKTAEDFQKFYDSFFPDLEEKMQELDEEESLLYLMALLTWGEEVKADADTYAWNKETWELYEEWMDELERYGF